MLSAREPAVGVLTHEAKEVMRRKRTKYCASTADMREAASVAEQGMVDSQPPMQGLAC